MHDGDTHWWNCTLALNYAYNFHMFNINNHWMTLQVMCDMFIACINGPHPASCHKCQKLCTMHNNLTHLNLGGHNFLSPFVDFDNFKILQVHLNLVVFLFIKFICTTFGNNDKPIVECHTRGFLSLRLIVGLVHYFICQQTWGKVGAKCCGKCHLTWMEYGRKINDKWMDEIFGWLKIIDEKNLCEWWVIFEWMMDGWLSNEWKLVDD